MGCCASSLASPYPSAAPQSSSSRAINPAVPQSNAAVPRHSTSNHSQARASVAPQGLDVPVNQPLRRLIWRSTSRQWSRSQLDNEREAFFDTRVTGRPEIWQMTRVALEILWAGRDAEQDNEGLETAQQILDSAEITRPTGDLTDGIFDSFGEHYPLPRNIVADPENMIDDPPSEHESKDGEETRSGAGDESGEADEEETLRRKEEKGKSVLMEADLVMVTARLSSGGSDGGPFDVQVSIGKGFSVRLLIQRIREAAKLPPEKSIQVIYMGKKLKKGKPLMAQWQEGHVVNAFVFG